MKRTKKGGKMGGKKERKRRTIERKWGREKKDKKER